MIDNEYSRKHIFFFDLRVSEMLENLLKNINRPFTIIDLGCGDGALLWALYKKGLLKNAIRIVGVDISEERIKRLKSFCPFAEGIVADIQNLKQIPNNFFDVAISNQVIEHVPDDTRMIKEVYRILKPGGYFYVSTVIKKWYGFWIYWNNGFKLDPTHVREYRSEEDFLKLLSDNGFFVKRWLVKSLSYPMMDLILRGLIKIGFADITSDIYQKYYILNIIRNFIKIKIIGYKIIEVLGMVKKHEMA